MHFNNNQSWYIKFDYLLRLNAEIFFEEPFRLTQKG